MENKLELREVEIESDSTQYTSSHVESGIPLPKPKRVKTFSFDEWERFTEEWAYSLKDKYHKVSRVAGSGDLGLDIIGFIKSTNFEDGWDNYQCKHYDHPLRPSDVTTDIGKIIYYSHQSEYTPPDNYYFICPQGIGTKLSKLLPNPTKLKEDTQENWDTRCKNKITETKKITLDGDFKEYFNNFDFSIFSSVSLVELIDGHSKTRFHSVRFGGGLKNRGKQKAPPPNIKDFEYRYIEQLLEAYSENNGNIIFTSVKTLEGNDKYHDDFQLQRERFFHAEGLRNFARDTVPEGTFKSLKEEIYHGVIDTCNAPYKDGFKRMRETIKQAVNMQLQSNPLISVIKVQDKQGLCHHLANEDKLTWVK